MLLNLKQQLRLNKVIEDYSKEYGCEWVTIDEDVQYKNTEFESLLIGLGVLETGKHLKDENVVYEVELTHYYQKQCKIFIQAFKKFDNTMIITVHKNNSFLNDKLENTTLLEKIEV